MVTSHICLVWKNFIVLVACAFSVLKEIMWVLVSFFCDITCGIGIGIGIGIHTAAADNVRCQCIISLTVTELLFL